MDSTSTITIWTIALALQDTHRYLQPSFIRPISPDPESPPPEPEVEAPPAPTPKMNQPNLKDAIASAQRKLKPTAGPESKHGSVAFVYRLTQTCPETNAHLRCINRRQIQAPSFAASNVVRFGSTECMLLAVKCWNYTSGINWANVLCAGRSQVSEPPEAN
jgi:hypothetical protein